GATSGTASRSDPARRLRDHFASFVREPTRVRTSPDRRPRPGNGHSVVGDGSEGDVLVARPRAIRPRASAGPSRAGEIAPAASLGGDDPDERRGPSAGFRGLRGAGAVAGRVEPAEMGP